MIRLFDQCLERLVLEGKAEKDETGFELPDLDEVVIGTLGKKDGVDFTVRSSRVSRRHCVIRKYPLCYSIEDLRSSFGTFVNDREIIHETPLMDGDKVSLGGYEYIINVTM